jgi:hypothetical protein
MVLEELVEMRKLLIMLLPVLQILEMEQKLLVHRLVAKGVEPRVDQELSL